MHGFVGRVRVRGKRLDREAASQASASRWTVPGSILCEWPILEPAMAGFHMLLFCHRSTDEARRPISILTFLLGSPYLPFGWGFPPGLAALLQVGSRPF
jgi:hypothetical protein